MRAWIFDLDGVIWRGDEIITDGARAAQELIERGAPVLFVTNFSYAEVATQEAKLARAGVDAAGRVINSAAAAAGLVAPGARAFVIGGPGLREALAARGAVEVSDEAEAEVVVLGYDPTFDYDRLARACRALWAGAGFVATNDDPTFPSSEGLLPGTGALVAALTTASGRQPTLAGKPYAPMADLVRRRLGDSTARGVMIGDRADTDGAFARTLGYDFALVLSGVTDAESAAKLDLRPDIVALDAWDVLSRLDPAG
jgi:4-nitrophenyl phosphatase